MRFIFRLFVFLFLSHSVSGQAFVNGDLEGDPQAQVSALAPGWFAVPAGDPISICNDPGTGDTPDLLSLQGPIPSYGMWGKPYSGLTFMSGVIGRSGSGQIFQEGIMQTVTGLVPDSVYEIGFSQAVVKSSNTRDPSGTWAVYADTTLLQVPPPTFSAAAFDDPMLSWAQRSFTFRATATQHTFKFVPSDDDSIMIFSETNLQGALRMGIDSIYITKLPCAMNLSLGSDRSLCAGQTLLLQAYYQDAVYSWSTGDSSAAISITQPGTYWLHTSRNGCTAADTVEVQFKPVPQLSLGADTSLCAGETLVLQAPVAGGTTLWHNGSSNPTFTATQTGTYWAQVTQNGCSTRDSIQVQLKPLPHVAFAQQPLYCLGDVVELSAANPGAAYLWHDQSTEAVYSAKASGLYAVEVTLNGCSTRAEIQLDFQDCETELLMPNIISPNADGLNDTFVPLKRKGITSMSTTIYNRWGNLLFNSETDAWGGTTKAGEPVAPGTYFYRISYQGIRSGTGELNGWLQVVH